MNTVRRCAVPVLCGGPYEEDPGNPILTSDPVKTDALQKCGHADLVQTQKRRMVSGSSLFQTERQQKMCPWQRNGTSENNADTGRMVSAGIRKTLWRTKDS